MKPIVWRTGGHGWTLLVHLKASDEGHKIEHKQTFDSVTRTLSFEMKPNVWRTGEHE
jgi:hypothetical protein